MKAHSFTHSLTQLGPSGVAAFGCSLEPICLKVNVYRKNIPFIFILMPSRWDSILLYFVICLFSSSLGLTAGGGCWKDKGSCRRLIFKRASVICCGRQSALSFAPVKEGSQRFKGQHCLCSAMLNHF